jgi:hypothetical protein
MATNMSTSHRKPRRTSSGPVVMVLDGLSIFQLILTNPLLVQKVEGSDLILQWKLYSNHFHADMWIQLD